MALKSETTREKITVSTQESGPAESVDGGPSRAVFNDFLFGHHAPGVHVNERYLPS